MDIALDDLLARYRPGSFDEPWSWDDEEQSLLDAICGCCGRPGHYQLKLEDYIREHGFPGKVWLGSDGRIWDGHHHIIAARRLGIPHLPVESDNV